MKWITFSIAFLLLTANGFAQAGHFVSVFNDRAPYYMNINVVSATINGSLLEVGDEIAVFDNNLCCAKIIISTPIVYLINSETIKVSKSYETPPNILTPGYTSGHTITYKFWDSSNSIEISGIEAQYINSSGGIVAAPTFTDSESAFVKLCGTISPTVGTITQPTCAVATGSVVLNNLPASGTWTLTRSPGGITSTGTGTNSTISSLTAGTYSFTVTAASGCTSAATTNVVIADQPATPTAPMLGTVTQATCAVATGSVVLNGLPASGTWTLTKSPGGITSTGTGTSSTISSLSAGTYTFSVTNASGCTSMVSSNVVIAAQSATPTVPTPGTITQPTCAVATGSVVLNNLPASGTWTLTRSPGGITSTGTGTSSTISSLTAGTYTFMVTNASGCTSAVSANVIITAQPATPTPPAIGTVTQPSCALSTGSVVLNGLPASGTWTLTRSPGGITSTGTGTSSTISSLTAGTYTFMVTNASGCTSGTSASVLITAQPATPTAPTLGTVTQATCAVATGSVVLNNLPASGTWTLTRYPGGITSTGTGTSSVVSSLTAGTYTFTVTSASGCTSAASASVLITAQPATPTAPAVGTITQPTCAVATGSVVLNGLPASGTWTLTRSPGGITSTGTGTSSTISSLTPGTYTFTVTNASGCTSTVSSNVVIAAQPATPTAPVVGAVTHPTTSVATGSVVLSGLPAAGTWTLTRSPGGISFTGTGTSSTVSLLSPGTYTYTATNASGCMSAQSSSVFINGRPTANAGIDQTINEGIVVALDGSASADPDNNTLTYSWSAPAGITLSSTTAAKPTFTAPEVITNQNYTFSLIVNDGTINSIADQVVITVKQVNKPPAANAGADQAVNEGLVVSLDGSASTDPDSNTLTYIWSAPAGISLSSTTAAKPTFTAPEVMTNQNYTISLIVNDGTINSIADQVVITVKQVNKAPAANAGADQTVDEGVLVTLDGSASTDPDNNTLTYIWSAPAGINLSSTTAAKPTFTAPEVMTNQNYTFSLIVNDGTINSIADQVVIQVRQVNKAPAANAGADQSVNEGAFVTLDGSASADPDNNTLTYIWSAPVGINLNSTTAAKPTFTAPEVMTNQNYTISLIVNDGTVNSIADQVIIQVKQVNKAPVANAGADQTVNEGSLVTLDGSASADADNNTLTYIWSAPAGITLSSTTASKPTFTAPEVLTDQNYTFSLVVNDGAVNSITDQVVITVKQVNKAPVANAGADQSVNEGSLITLDGSASSDPENTAITYFWSAPAGITLSSATASKPNFTAPEVLSDQNYTFSLVVNDGAINSVADQVVIQVKQVNKVPVANANVDQSVNEGSLVTLDGSASADADADGNTLTYSWSAPAGITLSATNAVKPTFTAPEVVTNQNFTISLIVNDGIVNSVADQVVIQVKQVNKAPVANAGPDQYLNEGVLVTLNGSASSDPDNNTLTYQWTAPEGIPLSSTTVAKPTFTAPEVMANQNYTFSLVVNDGTVSSTIDQVFVAVKQVNKAPVANAGADQSVEKNTLYSLDGTSSIDPDGDVLTYLWTAPDGIVLSSNTVARPTFTTPAITSTTNFTFTLMVSDGKLNSLSDQVIINVKQTNQTPVAKAGIDQSINEGVLVTLDGSASSDPDGDALVYSWLAPSGIIMSSTTAAKPTFTAPEVLTDQNYTFSLTVNDGTVNSTIDQVVVTVKQVNKAPVANAGIDQAVIEGSLVTLSGSSSYDPDNNTISFYWSAPAGITLNSPTVINPKFTAPNLQTDQDYVISLIVNDGIINSIADQVTITVKHINLPPVANAGTDQTVNEGVVVTFDGTASADPENNTLTYSWSAPMGITLSSTNVARPTFKAPEVLTDQNYTFSLFVNDGKVNSIADQVIIQVKQVNKVPLANAGADQTVSEGVVVTLDGSVSADPDNNTLTYLWSAPSGITLSSTTAAKPTFTAPPEPTSQYYTFSLIVNDGTVSSTPDQVTVQVKHTNKIPLANAGIDQTVNEGVLVTLDGTASSDTDNNTLTYSWSAPAGITLSSTSAAKPTFIAPEVLADQSYSFTLFVNDGTVNSIADQVVVLVRQINKAPTADAGADQTVNEGVVVTLDGSASTDPDKNALNFVWTAPSGVILSSANTAKPTFTAPEVLTDQSYEFSLIVNDGTLFSTADRLFITVKQVNKAPVLTTAKSLNVKADVPVEFVFEGSDSENNPINFSIENLPSFLKLTKKTNSSATLSGTFSNQNVGNNTFKLTLSDGVSSIQETIAIFVVNADDAPYVKEPIKNVSVDKSSNNIVIDLKSVFATTNQNTVLAYSIVSNTNSQIVSAKITGTDLTLSFSTEYAGLSQIVIQASANGKDAQSTFNVEVKIPTGIYQPDDDAQVSVYPNPTEGELHIKFDKIPENGTWINVYTQAGSLIIKSLIKSDEEILNLKGNVPGIYIIQIAQKNPKTFKVILK